MAGWHAFVRDMQEYYGVNMHCLTKQYDREQHDYYRCTAQWSEVHPHQLMAPPVRFKSYDMLTVTLDEVKASHFLTHMKILSYECACRLR